MTLAPQIGYTLGHTPNIWVITLKMKVVGSHGRGWALRLLFTVGELRGSESIRKQSLLRRGSHS